MKESIKRQIDEILYEEFSHCDKVELLRVVWEDARTLSGTSDYTGIKENGLLTANTIGYLVYEDENRIAICGFLFPDKHHNLDDPIQITAFRDVHIIPKGGIKQVIVLKNDYEESKKFREQHKNWFEKEAKNAGFEEGFEEGDKKVKKDVKEFIKLVEKDYHEEWDRAADENRIIDKNKLKEILFKRAEDNHFNSY